MRSVHTQEILRKSRTYRRERLLRRTLYGAGAVLALLLLLVALSRLPALQLQQISVQGTTFVGEAAVEKVIRTSLAGSYLGIVPRANFLVYSRDALEAAVERQFLRIASLTFTEQSPRALRVVIHEREPDAVWCEGSFVAVHARHCFYVDRDGVLYDQAPEFSGPVYFEFYGYVRQPPQLGDAILPVAQLTLARSVRNVLRALALEPVALVILPDRSYELVTEKGWKILFDAGGDAGTMGEHLRAALTSDVLTKRLADRNNALDYIDLRYGKKVFYKFKMEGGTTSASTAL